MTQNTEARLLLGRRSRVTPSAGALRLLLALALTFSFACASTPEQRTIQGILTINALQDGAAHAYEDAKKAEADAGAACAKAAQEKGVSLPTPMPDNVKTILATCAGLGTPLPFDPFKLRDAATPINVTYDAVRAANDVRLSVKVGTGGDVLGAYRKALGAVRSCVAALKELGVAIPAAISSALDALTDTP